ncbi:protein containing DUF772 [gut metagenome]|uniref:Protein containing DUF772 n=1 Tax=gut metagenome TaxID=749906 RepID=J9CXV9_9ZZZZ
MKKRRISPALFSYSKRNPSRLFFCLPVYGTIKKSVLKGASTVYVMVENQLSIYDFVEPFGGALDPNNRWIRLAEELNWAEMEQKYATNFGHAGAHALPFRMVFGSLVIREALELSDRQTVLNILENPYLQYFIGLPVFTHETPFAPHSLATFRKRIPKEEIKLVVKRLKKLTSEQKL